MAEYSTWDEVKAVLDDPAVSDDDKARILRAFADVHGSSPFLGRDPEFWDNAEEIEDYADRYGVTDDVRDRIGGFPSREERDAGQATLDRELGRAEWDRAVARAGEDLAGLPGRTVEGGGAGVGTSDEILEPGSRGMGFFALFLPPYRDWRCGGPDLHTDFENVYDELKSINFGRFRADAATMGQVHGELTEATLDLSTAAGDLRGVWSGPAADAADAYGRAFVGHGREVADSAGTASTLVTEAVAHIETAVLHRAQTVFGLWADTVDGLTPQDTSRVIRAARRQADRDELRDMRGWPMFGGLDDDLFSWLGWILWGDQVQTIMAQAAQEWLDGTFVALFDQKKKTFDEICASTRESVSEGWAAVVDGLNAVPADPFADLAGGIEVPRPDTEQGPSTQGPGAVENPTSGSPSSGGGGAPTAPSSSGSPSAPGGGGSGSGASGGGGSPQAPAVPTVPQGALTQLDQTPGAGTVPQLDDLITDGVGGHAGGGVGNALDPAPDTVTITDGDVSYTVSEPDAAGRATLTVDTGDGKPTTYQLDFGPTGADAGFGPERRVAAEGVLTPEPGTDRIRVTDSLTAERTEDGKIVLSTPGADGAAPKSYTVDFHEPTSADPASRLTGLTGLTGGMPVDTATAGGGPAGGGAAGGGSGGGGSAGGGSVAGGGSAGGGSSGGGASAPATPAPAGPGSFAGAMPAEAAPGNPVGGGVAAAPAASGGSSGGGGGFGAAPMMGGMGAGGGGNAGGTDREANRYLVAKDVFEEDFDRFARVKGMLDPESVK
ncbi:hypothetical protein L6E12_12630 [Actinokineospora sp. PR83]|uniref:WXG100 family type VII secretion target n=1 Tax=Actinokineospora sp. PR83 TaxID=2884908 RepID=UPI001F325ECC|nr:hypothetical protein [Actinokineospora sp. PR83]MCG8916636.1 hypothetical protein [Actinokineospora sp. PR83]